MDQPRARIPTTGVLVAAFTVLVLLLVVYPAPAADVPPSAVDSSLPPPGELTAIDVPLDALAILQGLGIHYQDQPRDGFYRAAATAAQLVQLQQEGVAFQKVGKVAIFSSGQEAPPLDARLDAYCSGFNLSDYSLTQSYTWVYSPIYLSCSGAGTVTSVDVHYILHNVWWQSSWGLSEIDLVLGSNSPSWYYINLDNWNMCTPGGPVLDAFQDVDQWVYNIHSFDGRPVNQRWDLVAQTRCTPTSPVGHIDAWSIYVYYTAPTATPTTTPTRTPTPTYCLSGKVFDGPVGDESHPLANVTVKLFGSNDQGSLGVELASTTTNASGYYQLCSARIYEYYNIVEYDPTGYYSVGATSVGGTVVNNNQIRYAYPLAGKTLTGNKFWDRLRVTNTPTRTPTQPPGPTWTPTRTPTATTTPQVGPDLRLRKSILSPEPPIVVSQTVRFKIEIINTGSTTFNSLTFSDNYDPNYLSYLGVADPPSDDNIDDGLITWSDLVTYFGPITPGRVVSVTIAFHAKAPTGAQPTRNCAGASYTLPNGLPVVIAECIPVEIAAPPPRIDVDKSLLGPPVVCVSDTVVFGVAYTNTGSVNIGGIVITDTYDLAHLSLLPPWAPPDTGVIHAAWAFWPNFPPGASSFFTLAFHAERPTNQALNEVTIKPLSFGVEGIADSDSASVQIEAPGPCQGNAVVNGGFEAGLGAPWMVGGNTPPVLVSDVKHGGANAVRFGGKTLTQQAMYTAGVGQWVFIPSNVATARLSFWYRMETSDVPPFDVFLLAAGGTSLPPTVHHIPLATTNWVRVVVDLTSYRGNSVLLVWDFGQDATQITTVWLDDIELCFAACGPLNGGPPPGGGPFCWKQDGLPDYAPSGVPDFSQKQHTWTYAPTQQWTYDAPVAAANSLWWFDSKFERATTPPPAVSDHYPLVTAYGSWDDHDQRNVVPLVNDLANRMGTNGDRAGTLPADVFNALRGYIESKQLAISYTVTYNDRPAWDWVKEEVKRSEDVILLLGFWEQQQDGWKRLGGHYVTAAGVSCYGNSIAISDPWLNNAERGGPGRVLGTPTPHPHPTAPPDGLHNDARLVSHDLYAILTTNAPGGDWGLARYVQSFEDVENFFGVNVPLAFVPYQAERYRRGEIIAVVEKAIAVSPVPAAVTLRLDPATKTGTVGDIVHMDLVLDASGQNADTVSAFLDFDPTMLTIVNAAGQPVSQVIPGPDFPTPFLNRVDNSVGHIDLVNVLPGGAPLVGRMTVATLLFKTLGATPSYGTPVEFVFTGERTTNVMSGGTSLLGPAQGGFVVVAGGRVLTGTVELQGRPTPPDPSWSVPLLLTFHDPGVLGSTASYSVTTNNRGQFIITNPPTGTFDIKIKGLHTLRNLLRNVVIADGSRELFLGVLLEGDANNDNVVSAADLSIVAAASGKSAGQPGFDARADFNNDGRVDGADLGLLQMNYGRRGDVLYNGVHGPELISPQATGKWAEASLAAGAVNLVLQPLTNTVRVGQIFTVEVRVEAGSQPIHAVDVHINLPPGLDVVSPDGLPVAVIDNTGVLPVEVQNHVDNATGVVDFAAAYAGTPPTGTFTVARMRLRAGQPIALWPIRFVQLPGRMTDVIYAEESVLGLLGASYVEATGYSLYLPVIISNWR